MAQCFTNKACTNTVGSFACACAACWVAPMPKAYKFEGATPSSWTEATGTTAAKLTYTTLKLFSACGHQYAAGQLLLLKWATFQAVDKMLCIFEIGAAGARLYVGIVAP